MKKHALGRDGAEVWQYNGDLCYITSPAYRYRNGRKAGQIGVNIRWIVDAGDGTADGATLETITTARFRSQFTREGRILTPWGHRFTIKPRS